MKKSDIISNNYYNAEGAKSFYKGTSFRVNKWAPDTYYFNDDQYIDWVIYNGVLCICERTHVSNMDNAPSIIYENKIPIGIESNPCWNFALGGLSASTENYSDTTRIKISDEKLYISNDDGETWEYVGNVGSPIDPEQTSVTAEVVSVYESDTPSASVVVNNNHLQFSFALVKGQDGYSGKDGVDGKNGVDGADGKDGTDGKDGITPKFKIENKYWYVSYDNGNTWEQVGKATGEDGKDGDIPEVDLYKNQYIFIRTQIPVNDFSLTPDNYQSDTNYQNDDYLPSYTYTDDEGKQQTLTWTKFATTVDETWEYQYWSYREKIEGIWGPYQEAALLNNYNTGEGGSAGIVPKVAYTSFVFCRSHKLVTDTDTSPTGGSYENPHPTSNGTIGGERIDEWYDAIPAGEGLVYMSTCEFNNETDYDTETAVWSLPVSLADTSDFQIEYSAKEIPNKPSSLQNYYDNDPINFESNWRSDNQDWIDYDDDNIHNAIWMATATMHNNIWSDWSIVKIKGETGADGTPIHIVGSAETYADLPACNDSNLQIGDTYTVKTYIDDSGVEIHNVLFTYSGDDDNCWIYLGPIEGTGAYVHIKYATAPYNDNTKDEVDENGIWKYFTRVEDEIPGETPGDYIGIYPDSNPNDSLDPSLYTWKRWKGEDGWNYEYVYKLTDTKDAPNVPDISENSSNFVPEHWSDDPQEISKDYPYCWMVYRHKDYDETILAYKWSKWIGSKNNPNLAALWAHYGQDGTDGTSPFHIELSNSYDQVYVVDNVVEVKQEVSTNIKVFKGNEDITNNVDISVNNGASYIDGVIKKVFNEGDEIDASTKELIYEITVAENSSIGLDNPLQSVFKIVKLNSNIDYDLEVYPPYITVATNDDNKYSNDTINIKVTKSNISTTDRNIVDVESLPDGYKIYYWVDKGEKIECTYSGSQGITLGSDIVQSIDKCLYIELKNGDTTIDQDSVEILRDGTDGPGVEYVYYLSTYDTTTWWDEVSEPDNNWGFDVPQAPWTDDPRGVNKDNPVEWVCQRVFNGISWEDWSSPAVFSHYGHDGKDGEKGDTGIGIKQVHEYYLWTEIGGSSNFKAEKFKEVVKNSEYSDTITLTSTFDGEVITETWTKTITDIDPTKPCLWNVEVIQYDNNDVQATDPALISQSGRGIKEVIEYYLVSDKNTGIISGTDDWSTDPQTVDKDHPYLWNYEKINFTDGTSITTDPVIIGVWIKGDDGEPGDSAHIAELDFTNDIDNVSVNDEGKALYEKVYSNTVSLIYDGKLITKDVTYECLSKYEIIGLRYSFETLDNDVFNVRINKDCSLTDVQGNILQSLPFKLQATATIDGKEVTAIKNFTLFIFKNIPLVSLDTNISRIYCDYEGYIYSDINAFEYEKVTNIETQEESRTKAFTIQSYLLGITSDDLNNYAVKLIEDGKVSYKDIELGDSLPEDPTVFAEVTINLDPANKVRLYRMQLETNTGIILDYSDIEVNWGEAPKYFVDWEVEPFTVYHTEVNAEALSDRHSVDLNKEIKCIFTHNGIKKEINPANLYVEEQNIELLWTSNDNSLILSQVYFKLNETESIDESYNLEVFYKYRNEELECDINLSLGYLNFNCVEYKPTFDLHTNSIYLPRKYTENFDTTYTVVYPIDYSCILKDVEYNDLTLDFADTQENSYITKAIEDHKLQLLKLYEDKYYLVVTMEYGNSVNITKDPFYQIAKTATSVNVNISTSKDVEIYYKNNEVDTNQTTTFNLNSVLSLILTSTNGLCIKFAHKNAVIDDSDINQKLKWYFANLERDYISVNELYTLGYVCKYAIDVDENTPIEDIKRWIVISEDHQENGLCSISTNHIVNNIVIAIFNREEEIVWYEVVKRTTNTSVDIVDCFNNIPSKVSIYDPMEYRLLDTTDNITYEIDDSLGKTTGEANIRTSGILQILWINRLQSGDIYLNALYNGTKIATKIIYVENIMLPSELTIGSTCANKTAGVITSDKFSEYTVIHINKWDTNNFHWISLELPGYIPNIMGELPYNLGDKNWLNTLIGRSIKLKFVFNGGSEEEWFNHTSSGFGLKEFKDGYGISYTSFAHVDNDGAADAFAPSCSDITKVYLNPDNSVMLEIVYKSVLFDSGNGYYDTAIIPYVYPVKQFLSTL